MKSKKPQLYGCIYIPDFPVQAILRTFGKGRKEVPVVVLDGPDSREKVFACNSMARSAGIITGMTKSQAEVISNLVLQKRLVEQEEAAHSALIDCCYSVSPSVESTCPGAVLVDLTGGMRLHGEPLKIARSLAARATQCNLEVHVALAANPDSALYAARGFAGVTVISAGQEANRMAQLPVDVLQPEPELLDTLHNWGIRDFQSLAALPAVPLIQRLGKRGVHLQQLARGEVQRTLTLAEPITRFHETIKLEEPLELLEPLAFVINRLLEQLMGRLVLRSLATDHVEINLGLEVHADRRLKSTKTMPATPSFHQRALKLPVPTHDVKILLKLLQLDLTEHPPQAPVRKITLELFPAQSRFAQAAFFEPRAPEPAKLEVTLARLRAIVGEQDEFGRGLVGFPSIKDSHKPNGFEVLPFRPETKRREYRKHSNGPRMALRMFRPPLRAKVELTSNVPAAIIFQGTRKEVVNVSGPWRKNGAWWNITEEWARDEWDVEVRVQSDKGLYRLFRDHRLGQWFVEGMYD